MSGYVTPIDVVNSVADSGAVNAQITSHLRHIYPLCRKRAKQSNRFFIQFRKRQLGTLQAALIRAVSATLLACHIFHVVFVRANKQVPRINARSVVATMADRSVLGVFARGKEVRQAMSFESRVSAIPGTAFRSGPYPTLIRRCQSKLAPKIPTLFFGELRDFVGVVARAHSYIL